MSASALAGAYAALSAQHAGAFRGSLDDPAINYSSRPLDNVVDEANRKLSDGSLRFTFDSRNGYLNSVLEALQLPIDSQLLVFSRGSLQGKLIGDQNPRAVFFNDRVQLGWTRDGDVLEVAANDATAGVVFYTLQNTAPGPVEFKRVFHCLGCHVTGDTLGVPGLLMFSTTRKEGTQFDGVPRHVDQSDPIERRFGGWFVTGSTGSARHLGNDIPALDDRPSHELASVDRLFELSGYRTVTSDVVAHLVLTHQAGMTNLLTRAGWEARMTAAADEAAVAPLMDAVAREVVDHLLFVDEAPLPDRVHGSSGFTERFSKRGPRDRKGRSLYELDLTRHVFKYRCSYLIYSPAFDALPPRIKTAIYRRMRDVLAEMPREEAQPVVEILRDTKNGLPEFFQLSK